MKDAGKAGNTKLSATPQIAEDGSRSFITAEDKTTSQNDFIADMVNRKINVLDAIINNKKSNFIAENTDCLDFVNTAKMMNLSAVAYDGVVARNKLIELNNSENEVYVIARVPFSYISASTGSQENGLHYVNVNGELVTDENDITWLKVGPTSTNDGPARTINDNWKSENGNMYVKVSAVEKIVVLE